MAQNKCRCSVSGAVGTPLHLAVSNRCVSVIHILIEAGANVNSSGGFLIGTPLDRARQIGRNGFRPADPDALAIWEREKKAERDGIIGILVAAGATE